MSTLMHLAKAERAIQCLIGHGPIAERLENSINEIDAIDIDDFKSTLPDLLKRLEDVKSRYKDFLRAPIPNHGQINFALKNMNSSELSEYARDILILEQSIREQHNLHSSDHYKFIVNVISHDNSVKRSVLEEELKKSDLSNIKDGSGWSLLMYAAKAGAEENAKILIANGADVNACSSEGWSPLIFSAKKGNSELIKYILDANANINHATKGGTTALMEAAENGHQECVEILLKRNANTNAYNDEGFNALSLACWHGHLNCVMLLIEKMTLQEIEKKNDKGPCKNKNALEISREGDESRGSTDSGCHSAIESKIIALSNLANGQLSLPAKTRL